MGIQVVDEITKQYIYNNPGNIEAGQNYAGETGKLYDKRFVEFDSPQMGIRALARDLRTKINRHDGDVSKIINQYAPRSENPATYEKYVKEKVGDIVTEKELPNLVRAVIEFENKPSVASVYLQPKIFNEGIKLSEVGMPSGTFLDEARDIVYGAGRRAVPRPKGQPRDISEDIQNMMDFGPDKRKGGITVIPLKESENKTPQSTSEGLRQLIDMSSPRRIEVDEPYETYERMRPYFETVEEEPQPASPGTVDIFNAIKGMF